MFAEDRINTGNRQGWIEVITGGMFSGKTEELIRRIKRAQLANQKIEVFKPKIDTRYSGIEVISHDANSIISIPVDTTVNIIVLSENAEVVGIDEAQFFDLALVDVCNELANKGKRVILAGLDMDYQGKPFGPMPDLLAIADYITKFHAICPRCGSLAQYTFRKTAEKKRLVLGEKDIYEPLCRRCFLKAQKR
jgi:thymidine kinase